MDEWLEAYRDRAVSFVQARYRDDPQMMLAASELMADRAAGDAMLDRAAGANGSGAARAAQTEALLGSAPRYYRIEASGIDPQDRAQIAQAQELIARQRLAGRLPGREADRLGVALAAWRAAERQNALPVALEGWRQYGLGNDDAALRLWQQAATLPAAELHIGERAHAVVSLLERMGMPRAEAIAAAGRVFDLTALQRVEESARIAVYEGRVAQMQGRGDDAVATWQAAGRLGEVVQRSADVIAELTEGAAIQRTGASPVWAYVPDTESGIPNGPLMRARYFFGPQHAFYVAQAGEARDRELLDSLLRSAVRLRMLRVYGMQDRVSRDYGVASELLRFGQIVAWFGLVVGALFLALASWRGREAADATRISPAWQIGAAAAAVLALSAGAGIVVSVAPQDTARDLPTPLPRLVFAALAVSVVVAVLVSLAAVPFTRRASASVMRAWRGNLGRTLPASVALAAVVYLALGIAAAHLRARWVYECWQRDPTEIARMERIFGPRWANPAIPPDAFRAEYPPPGQ